VRPLPAPLWSDSELLNNFCTVFASFISRLICKIRVSRLLVTVRVSCLLKTAATCTQTYHVGVKKWFFSGDSPAPSNTPTPLDAYSASPLSTQILNTPLTTVYCLTNGRLRILFRMFSDENSFRYTAFADDQSSCFAVRHGFNVVV